MVIVEDDDGGDDGEDDDGDDDGDCDDDDDYDDDDGPQHDSGRSALRGESQEPDKKERGNYIMYARATSGDKLNNNKFLRLCSVKNISQVLREEARQLFRGESLS